jgi:hypothetical protein
MNTPAARAVAGLQTTTFGGVTKVAGSTSLSDILAKIPISQVTQIDPTILGLIGQGVLTPTPAQTLPSTTPTPAPAPTTPVDLQLAVLAIPTAYEGQPITSEYHNALRDAVRLLAGHLGANAVGQIATQTFSPAFLPTKAKAPWQLDVGVAAMPDNQSSWDGWFPVQLPDGSSIEGAAAIGRGTGALKSFQVKLLRQNLLGLNPDNPPFELLASTLITMDLSSADPNLPVQGIVSGSSAAVVQDYKIVDNTKYKYIIYASVERGDGQVAQINAVQVYCRVS